LDSADLTTKWMRNATVGLVLRPRNVNVNAVIWHAMEGAYNADPTSWPYSGKSSLFDASRLLANNAANLLSNKARQWSNEAEEEES
jgi:hypothetical protein